jgi:hypothetical protein
LPKNHAVAGKAGQRLANGEYGAFQKPNPHVPMASPVNRASRDKEIGARHGYDLRGR